jgi:PEP-CTERM motif
MRALFPVLRQVAVSAIAISSFAIAAQASAGALSSASTEYMGYYVPGEPASEALEASYVNILNDLAVNTTTTVASRNYFRSGNILCFATCPDALVTFAFKNNSGSNSVNLDDDANGDWAYLIGKYDGPNGGSMVWDVSLLDGAFTIPTKGPEDLNFGLSHFTLFKSQGGTTGECLPTDPGFPDCITVVPEPGALSLVALGLFAAGWASRRRKA